jgi:hypothetical protein
VIWVIVAVAVAFVGLVVFIVTRRPRQEPGVASFRRHIDALSPEARREVMDRVRKPPAEPDQTDQQQNGE